jgi:hypothetical protein
MFGRQAGTITVSESTSLVGLPVDATTNTRKVLFHFTAPAIAIPWASQGFFSSFPAHHPGQIHRNDVGHLIRLPVFAFAYLVYRQINTLSLTGTLQRKKAITDRPIGREFPTSEHHLFVWNSIAMFIVLSTTGIDITVLSIIVPFSSS